jgi:transcriptional regulator with XRE-family HTH domain
MSPLMGEISPTVNTWRGIFRESRHGRVPCDISPMGNVQRIRDAIESEMKKKGFSRRSLSSAAGLSESAVRDLLTRVDNPGIGTLRKVAEALEMPVDALTGAGLMVPVVGKIGAGGEVLFSLDPDVELHDDAVKMVPRPPLVSGRLMALEVVGSSMLPKYEDGEIIYVRAPSLDRGHVPDDAIGAYCAVRTSDGGTYLKVLTKGSQEERFTLRSLNAPDMENVEVIWASRVMFVTPAPPKGNEPPEK